MENSILVRDLTKRFPGFTLDRVSFQVPKGRIVGFIGENGAGKSTTIRLILNDLKKDGGTVELLGRDHTDPAVKNDLGVVFDACNFPEVFTPLDVEKVLSGVYSVWDGQAYRGYLKRFALPERKRVKTFSKGMKMKLSIAAALAHRPRLLILDEATSGLDPIVRDEVLEIFNEFTREEDHSILISSHILSDLEKLCDYIAFLHRGQLLFCDEKDQLLETYGVFAGTAEQLESLREEAVLGRESSGYGGVRALVRREEVPAGLELERATVEDIILFMVKGAK